MRRIYRDVSTTTFPPDYGCVEPECLYLNYGGPSEQWEMDYEGVFDFSTALDVAAKVSDVLSVVHITISFVGLFINLLHLFVLAQKELRTNFIFVVMTCICLCDIVTFFEVVYRQLFNWDIFYTIEPDCNGGRRYFHCAIDWSTELLKIICRTCSALLNFCTASIRAISVIFPMSSIASSLMTPRNGILTFIMILIITSIWQTLLYYSFIRESLDCPSYKPTSYKRYTIDYIQSRKELYEMVQNYFVLTLCVLYILVTILLLLELRNAKKRRSNLRTEKSPNNTSTLLIVMSISFFLSNLSYVTYTLLNNFVPSEWEVILLYGEKLKVMHEVFLTANSALHGVIVLLMSSQYRSVVRGLCCRKRGESSSSGPSSSSSRNSVVPTGQQSNKKEY